MDDLKLYLGKFSCIIPSEFLTIKKKSTAEGEGGVIRKKLILQWNSSYCRRLELYQVWGIQLSIELNSMRASGYT